MADKKITDLTALAQAASGDVFAIVDIDAGPAETKKITTASLFSSPQPIGSANPSTGEFTSLEFDGEAVVISSFSADTNLGTSNTAVPTQNAVKSYVDSQISGLAPNRISQGNSSVIVLDSTSPATIRFTVDGSIKGTFDSTGLALASGVTVNEISNDATLADASQTALITEYAAKAYIDSHSGGSSYHNQLLGLQGGDSTTSEFYHLKEQIYDNLFEFGTTGSGIGEVGGTNLTIDPDSDEAVAEVDQVRTLILTKSYQTIGISGNSTITLDTNSIDMTIQDTTNVLNIAKTGIALENGTRVNEFSTDGTLSGDSDDAIPTEKAVKTYVDNAPFSGNLNVRNVYTDSTAADGDALLVDTTGGVVSIELQPANNAAIIVKKITTDGNDITITVSGGLIDNMPFKTIDTYLQALTCISDGTNYYVT